MPIRGQGKEQRKKNAIEMMERRLKASPEVIKQTAKRFRGRSSDDPVTDEEIMDYKEDLKERIKSMGGSIGVTAS